ncbi:hypothetical protein J2Z83_001528 [Virgibacillus natechei]|uniref:RadC-like JAB domain-containing protein n=1 Tax=Virgibacillus natechei TaxID=1216297 RepID=A0ABS4IEP9_9BACI|nr:hypothetical protein [Virgibacillus natechei]
MESVIYTKIFVERFCLTFIDHLVIMKIDCLPDKGGFFT